MGKPSLAERAKLPMKSIKYPFFGLLPSANVLMLSLSRGSNVTFPQLASTPSGNPRRGGSLFIWAVSPIFRISPDGFDGFIWTKNRRLLVAVDVNDQPIV